MLRKNQGFTLIELMIVVLIIGVLASVAFPAYTNYSTKTKRALAKSQLTQIASRQEMFFADNKRYADHLAELGWADKEISIDSSSEVVSSSAASAIYTLSLTNTDTKTYTAVATPLNAQATADTDCGTLTITQSGTKTVTGSKSVADCW